RRGGSLRGGHGIHLHGAHIQHQAIKFNTLAHGNISREGRKFLTLIERSWMSKQQGCQLDSSQWPLMHFKQNNNWAVIPRKTVINGLESIARAGQKPRSRWTAELHIQSMALCSANVTSRINDLRRPCLHRASALICSATYAG